jgi:hypothetical protein
VDILGSYEQGIGLQNYLRNNWKIILKWILKKLDVNMTRVNSNAIWVPWETTTSLDYLSLFNSPKSTCYELTYFIVNIVDIALVSSKNTE